jgi:hypothetical protein
MAQVVRVNWPESFDRPYEEQKLDRFFDDPDRDGQPDPADVLPDDELEEYWKQRRSR